MRGWSRSNANCFKMLVGLVLGNGQLGEGPGSLAQKFDAVHFRFCAAYRLDADQPRAAALVSPAAGHLRQESAGGGSWG